MTKVNMVRKSETRRHKTTRCPLGSCGSKGSKVVYKKKKLINASEKKEWEGAICSVCLEYPHNAVMLLCSSYHKGCRPYMCATSCRYSNCLEQYKKAHTKVNSTEIQFSQHGLIDESELHLGLDFPGEKTEVTELLCPLCRGQVKGWTVVERARKYLNKKKRTCMQDKCSFVGSFKELRTHVRAEHPWARPRVVDPSLAEKWKKLENERDQNDVMSTIRSSMPGAIVMGDYVIEGNYRGFPRSYDASDYLDLSDVFLRLESHRGGRNDHSHSHGLFERAYQTSWVDDNGEIHHSGSAAASARIDNYLSRVRRHNRMFIGGSRRHRRRRRTGSENQ